MKECLEDPETPKIVAQMMEVLRRGGNLNDYYITVHNKVESKVSKRAEDGLITDWDKELLFGVKPRLISYFSERARITDWMILGPFVKHHYSVQKLYGHTTGGTPIFDIGDFIADRWKQYDSEADPVAAAVGDASKWDHSMCPEYMGIECEFVTSFYKPEYWKMIETIYEHTMWPICFTRLGFCYTVSAHRMSGWIFTWMNSFLNAIIHKRAWCKTLGLPMSISYEDFCKILYFGVDGDDNFHIAPSSILNEKSMECVRKYMKECNIVIRSQTKEGYRLVDDVTDIDYLSHKYSPVYISCDKNDLGALPPNFETEGWQGQWHRRKMLPRRPVPEMLGKLSYTIKAICNRDTVRFSKEVIDWCNKKNTTLHKILNSKPKNAEERHIKVAAEAVCIEASKIASYLFMYPHYKTIRTLCISLLSVLGFPGDAKFFRDWKTLARLGEINLKTDEVGMPEQWKFDKPTSLQKALKSIYGEAINTLDDIQMVESEIENRSLHDHYLNILGALEHYKLKLKPGSLARQQGESYSKCCIENQPKKMLARALRWTLSKQLQTKWTQVPYPIYWTLWRPAMAVYSRWQKDTAGHIENWRNSWLTKKDFTWYEEYAPDRLLHKLADPDKLLGDSIDNLTILGKKKVDDVLAWLIGKPSDDPNEPVGQRVVEKKKVNKTKLPFPPRPSNGQSTSNDKYGDNLRYSPSKSLWPPKQSKRQVIEVPEEAKTKLHPRGFFSRENLEKIKNDTLKKFKKKEQVDRTPEKNCYTEKFWWQAVTAQRPFKAWEETVIPPIAPLVKRSGSKIKSACRKIKQIACAPWVAMRLFLRSVRTIFSMIMFIKVWSETLEQTNAETPEQQLNVTAEFALNAAKTAWGFCPVVAKKQLIQFACQSAITAVEKQVFDVS